MVDYPFVVAFDADAEGGLGAGERGKCVGGGEREGGGGAGGREGVSRGGGVRGGCGGDDAVDRAVRESICGKRK